MPKNSRGKMKVTSVEDYGYDNSRTGEFSRQGQIVRMACEYDPGNPADVAFSIATPSGTLETRISNPNLLDTFAVGDFFYLDLTPCA